MRVEILADTSWPPIGKTEQGSPVRITTFRLEFWRAILPQILTHRQFSRSTSSSRAQVTPKIKASFYMPRFSREQRGMQGALDLSPDEQVCAEDAWDEAFTHMQYAVDRLEKLGVHRQHRNRLLEPFTECAMVLTATEWENFFTLRRAPEAQHEIRELADAMYDALHQTTPVTSPFHIPYMVPTGSVQTLFDVSAACCARVSYRNDHQRGTPPIDETSSLSLTARLLRDKHMSPFEHQAVAYPLVRQMVLSSIWRPLMDEAYNLRGWASYRYLLDKGWAKQLFDGLQEEFLDDRTTESIADIGRPGDSDRQRQFDFG